MGDVPFKPEHLVAKDQGSRISDIPVPQGSWKEYYNKRNTKWNIHLGASAIILGLSLYAVSSL